MSEKGFEVTVLKDGTAKRNVQHVTALGSHCDKSVFELQIAISEPNVLPVIVDGRKNVIVMHGVPKKLTVGFRPYKVRKEIPLHGTGVYASTRYPENNVRLIEWRENGNFTMSECAIVAQNNIVFYSCQKTYADRCFMQDGKVVCPRFEAPWANRPWPQLSQLLKPGFFNKPLPSIESWQPEEQSLQKLSPRQAVVQWFNIAMGYGAVMIEDGTIARVHWKNIETVVNNFRSLSPGDLVTYERLAPIRIGAGTSFTQDCIGVVNSFTKHDSQAALR